MGKVLFVDFREPDPGVINAAATVVLEGGVVLSPTDTVYGLACDPKRTEAVERIREIKGRSTDKGFLLLLPGPGWVSELAAAVPPSFQPLERLWPGPVTFLFAAGEKAPGPAVGSEKKIGVRCPAEVFLQIWLETLGRPLLSTSANRAEEDVPRSNDRLRELFEDSVDLLLLSGEKIESKASTVLDLTVHPPQIVRRGEWAGNVHNLLAELGTKDSKLEARDPELGTRNSELL